MGGSGGSNMVCGATHIHSSPQSCQKDTHICKCWGPLVHHSSISWDHTLHQLIKMYRAHRAMMMMMVMMMKHRHHHHHHHHHHHGDDGDGNENDAVERIRRSGVFCCTCSICPGHRCQPGWCYVHTFVMLITHHHSLHQCTLEDRHNHK